MQRHEFNFDQQQQQQSLRYDFGFNPSTRAQPNLVPPPYSYAQQRFPVNPQALQQEQYHQEYISPPNYKLPGLANLNAANNPGWPISPPISTKPDMAVQGAPQTYQNTHYARTQDLETRLPIATPQSEISPQPKPTIEKPHPCGHPGCNQKFRRIEHARRHRDGVHFKLKPFCCPYANCEKKFARSDNLRQHIKSIHRKLSAASI